MRKILRGYGAKVGGIVSAISAAAIATVAKAQVTYTEVFSATNAEDTIEQIGTDVGPFVLYGLATLAVLMVAYRWFKKIVRGVASGKVK